MLIGAELGPLVTLYEQVYLQRSGYALIMLWIVHSSDKEDEHDPDAERTAKQGAVTGLPNPLAALITPEKGS